MAKLYRGKAALFNAETHKDGLFFATDINEIYLSFTGSDGNTITRVYGSEFLIKNVDLNSEGTKLVITYREGNSKEIDIANLLAKATQDAAGLMSAQDKKNLDTLFEAYSNDELGKVQGVAEDDKVLSITDKIVSATISLNYNSATKSIQLLGKNDSEGNPYVLGTVDATPFIKDGMLDDVEIVTLEETDGENTVIKKYIQFTWNVEDEETGELKSDLIALEDIAITYTEGLGIQISETNTIGVKIAESTETKKNFITVDDSGLAVNQVDTEATVLQKEIVVAGLSGTLGTGNYANGDVIPVGTSIYTILQNILSQELYPSNARISNEGGLSSKFSAPTFTLTNSGKTVEVGTAATVSGVTGYDPTPTKTSRSYSGFDNGYSLEDDDTADSTSNPPSVEVGDATLLSGTYKLTRTYSGFGLSGAALTQTSESEESAASCSIDEDSTLIVKEGTNKVTYKMEGPGYTAKLAGSPEYYVVSNLGNTQSDKVVEAVEEKTLSNSTATAGSKELSVTGAYNYYIGYATAIPADTEDAESNPIYATSSIKALKTFSGWISSSGNDITTGGTLPAGKTMCICVPSSYKLSSIMNGFDLESVESFTKTTATYELADNTTVSYSIYSMSSAADWKFKTIKIVKA